MKKSLVPLIAVLFCIVLLTAIIVNTRPEIQKPVIPDIKLKKQKAIYLSNIETAKEPGLLTRKQHIMDEKKILNLLLKAYSALDKGNISEAQNQVKTVLIFQAENNEALSLLGRIYYLKHEYKKAEMIFRRQIEVNKKFASAYNNLGQALLKQKKYSKAASQLLIAQDIDPKSGLIALNIAGVYAQQEKKKEALAAFKKAFELMGAEVITAANHPALDNIRKDKEFRNILKEAYKQLAIEQKNKSKKK